MTQITESFIQDHLADALSGVDLSFLGSKTSGKVREIYQHTDGDEDQLIIVTTDRLSAFDRILGLVPFKGQVLNQLAAFWFEQTRRHRRQPPDRHARSQRDRGSTLRARCRSRWSCAAISAASPRLRSGTSTIRATRTIYGIDFPDGLQKNDPLPEPIITPTTKASDGGHDERITNEQVTSMGLVEPAMWAQVQRSGHRRSSSAARRLRAGPG